MKASDNSRIITDLMHCKVIIPLTKENALNQIKTAKSHIDISKIQLLCKTKNEKYVILGVYEFKGEILSLKNKYWKRYTCWLKNNTL